MFLCNIFLIVFSKNGSARFLPVFYIHDYVVGVKQGTLLDQ